MLFTWDEKKRQSNLKKHGIDFACAADISPGRPSHGRTADLITEKNVGLARGCGVHK